MAKLQSLDNRLFSEKLQETEMNKIVGGLKALHTKGGVKSTYSRETQTWSTDGTVPDSIDFVS